MLTEAQYHSVLNFFYFLLLDEAMALGASIKAITRIQKIMKKNPESQIETVLISSVVDVFEKYQEHKEVVPTAPPPKSDWHVTKLEYLVAWKEYMRKAEPQFSVALVLRYVLGFQTDVISRAIDVPDGTIHFKFNGSAGQSFGCFLSRGVTLELEGDANDYCGKGLSGGRVIVYPPKISSFKAEENIIAGNVIAYGAIAGDIYLRGVVGERFCVRNSGAEAVVEGVGDHACEYMTGGRVVVIGPTGRNFAAGMSGGIAYVYDASGQFRDLCNLEMVELEHPDKPEDIATIRRLLENHHKFTGSTVAKAILADFDEELKWFVKVMPTDYRRVLEHKTEVEERAKQLAQRQT